MKGLVLAIAEITTPATARIATSIRKRGPKGIYQDPTTWRITAPSARIGYNRIC